MKLCIYILKCAYCAVFVSFIFFSASCSKDELSLQDLNDSNPQVVNFKGEQVYTTDDEQRFLLGLSDEEFSKHYMDLHKRSSVRMSLDDSLSQISYSELVDIIKPYLSIYPDIGWESEISYEDQKRIFRDIPSIKTVDDIRKKGDVIIEYYSSIALKEILPAIIKYKRERSSKDRNSRVYDLADVFNLEPYEETVITQIPLFVPLYVTATGQAEMVFAGPDGMKRNSAKHAAWNCFGIRNIILTGIFKNPAITYMRKGTSAHEMTSTGGQNRRMDNLMDLNSNMVGRRWMDNNTSWGLGPLRFMPNEGAIIAHMTNLANNGLKITYDWHVLDRYPPGGTTAWDILYTHNTGPNPFLMFLID